MRKWKPSLLFVLTLVVVIGVVVSTSAGGQDRSYSQLMGLNDCGRMTSGCTVAKSNKELMLGAGGRWRF